MWIAEFQDREVIMAKVPEGFLDCAIALRGTLEPHRKLWAQLERTWISRGWLLRFWAPDGIWLVWGIKRVAVSQKDGTTTEPQRNQARNWSYDSNSVLSVNRLRWVVVYRTRARSSKSEVVGKYRWVHQWLIRRAMMTTTMITKWLRQRYLSLSRNQVTSLNPTPTLHLHIFSPYPKAGTVRTTYQYQRCSVKVR